MCRIQGGNRAQIQKVKNMKVEVVGIGTPMYDMVMNVTKMPELDGATGANEAFYQGGGKVATAMAAVARLGKKAGMIARVGENHRGQFIVNDFKYNGVDTSAIVVSEKGTSSSFCLSLSEETYKTRIFIGKGGNCGELKVEDIDFDYIKDAKYLHLENGRPASKAAAEFAKANGITTVIDADGYSDEIVALLPLLDVFIPSEFFYKKYIETFNLPDDYEGFCKDIMSKGPQKVILTLGSKGCVGLTEEDGFFHVDSYKVNVRDTTGAGDVFHGAFIVGMLEGMAAPACAKFASAVAALKCTFIGGRTGIPNRETVRKFMETGEYDQTEALARLEYYRSNL